MRITYDTKKLNVLLKDFYLLTKMRPTVFDDNFVEIAQYPERLCDFCAEIKSHPQSCDKCKQSDITAFNTCKRTGQPYTYKCHAGLVETVAPIKCENAIIGYMMFGQVTDVTNKELGWEDVFQRVQDYPVDLIYLRDCFYRLRTTSSELINAASHILEACAGYLWLSDYFVTANDSLGTRIEQYINRNISTKMTSDTLCKELSISRAALYHASRHSFGMGIARYIKEKRIHLAKQLLLVTDYKISDVADMVGIGQYNYFTKLFKADTGMTPKEFRNSAATTEDLNAFINKDIKNEWLAHF